MLTPIVMLQVMTSGGPGFSGDLIGHGIGRIAGTVKDDGTPDIPVYRRVRLLRDVDARVVREAWSDPLTGQYSFDHVDELDVYTVISYDHTGNYRAVIADRLVPELMS